MSYTQDVELEDVVRLLEALWLDLNSERRASCQLQLDDIAARHQ